MYRLPPVFKIIETPIPDCVYKMRRIGENSIITLNSSESVNETSPQEMSNVEELDKRWTAIAARLGQLQKDINDLKTGNAIEPCEENLKMSTPISISDLAIQQDKIIYRISELMATLSILKFRLTWLEDPQNSCSLNKIEEWQKTLLSHIKQLNSEIQMLSTAFVDNNNTEDSCFHHIKESAIKVLAKEFNDLVINANPSRPPYSLQLIKKLLEAKGLSVFASTHVHSSASERVKDDHLLNFLRSEPSVERSKAHLALTLIWKISGNIEEPCLIVSPSSQAVPIRGEANIARYIARLVPIFNYETADNPHTAKLDQFLDLTDNGSALGSNACKRHGPAVLQMVEKTLTNLSLDGGKEIGLVDAVVYSGIMNLSINLDKDVGKNTSAWIQRCKMTAEMTELDSLSSSPLEQSVFNRSSLENYFKQIDIAFHTLEHPQVFTVAAMMDHVTSLPGFHTKNLFVKDKKKGTLYLLSARHDVPVALNQVAKAVGAKELRFAEEEVLYQTLGVRQGCVTAFALINDRENQVHFILDSKLVSDDENYLNFHPLTNDATTTISVKDFKTFLKATNHNPILIDL